MSSILFDGERLLRIVPIEYIAFGISPSQLKLTLIATRFISGQLSPIRAQYPEALSTEAITMLAAR